MPVKSIFAVAIALMRGLLIRQQSNSIFRGSDARRRPERYGNRQPDFPFRKLLASMIYSFSFRGSLLHSWSGNAKMDMLFHKLSTLKPPVLIRLGIVRLFRKEISAPWGEKG